MNVATYVDVETGAPVTYELDPVDGTAKLTIGRNEPKQTFTELSFNDPISWQNFVRAVASANKQMLNQGKALEAAPSEERPE